MPINQPMALLHGTSRMTLKLSTCKTSCLRLFVGNVSCLLVVYAWTPLLSYANDNCLGCTHDKHIVHKSEQYMQINMANGNVE